MMKKLTLKRLYNTIFKDFYTKLLVSPKEVNTEYWSGVLALALYFVSLDERNIQKLGYRLFLIYSKYTQDYIPLYEFSVNKGLVPISQFIEENLNYSMEHGNIYTLVNNIFNSHFKRDNTYLTYGQDRLYKNAIEKKEESQIIVAPTSYGKTDLIISFLKEYSNRNICIITPTKSLLAQTKKRIINATGMRKIITQPEMYVEGETNIIAILTQERYLRMLQNNPELSIDLLIVDEAHNLLEKFDNQNIRSLLLASCIITSYRRNPRVVCKYLTPFVTSASSLQLEYLPVIENWYFVDEYMKSEMYFFYDIKNREKLILDQFSPMKDRLYKVETTNLDNDCDIVIENIGQKNIIYLNKPKDIENFAKVLSKSLPDISRNLKLKQVISDLKEFVHEDYNLIRFIKYGVVYHHGSIPELVRIYVENVFDEIREVKMLVANSTLLEGVNFPATKLFILDPSRGSGFLSPSAFKNLVGRICRFSEIFNPENGSLDYLLPEIHIVFGEYCRKNINIRNFIRRTKILIESENTIKDTLENPLLKGFSSNNNNLKDSAKEILENLTDENKTRDKNIRKATTKIGALCFQNNIHIFDIFKVENQLDYEIKQYKSATGLEEVFQIMASLFFSKIDKNNFNSDNIKRLINIKAQKFYIMLISWRINGLAFKEMVNQVVAYWDTLDAEQAQCVFVGKWGDKTRGIKGFQTYWTDITLKERAEKVNLAIVRIKEEFDFIDNEILKYVEVLASLDLIEEAVYLRIKYGTDDKKKIALLNCGVSNFLASILTEKYSNYFKADLTNNSVSFKEGLIKEMENNNENGILITELKLSVPDDLM